MGLRDRLQAESGRLVDAARRSASEAPSSVGRAADELRDLRGLLSDEETSRADRFLLTLVGIVRDDEGDELGARDVYVAARKRRRRLGLVALSTGPLAGAVNKLADLYCELAVICDLSLLHHLDLTDEDVAAHALALWGLVGTPEAGHATLAGDPPLTDLLQERAGAAVDDDGSTVKWTKMAILRALWNARSAFDDMGSGSVRTVMFTGRRTKRLIRKAEAQLDVA